MKKLVLSLLIVFASFNVFAGGGTVGSDRLEIQNVMTEDQAKSVALIQARALYVQDDILAVVRTELEPVYSIANISHLSGLDVYQIDIRRMQPGLTCQQNIVINNRTGELVAKQVAKCE
jgi:hypothetical protein